MVWSGWGWGVAIRCGVGGAVGGGGAEVGTEWVRLDYHNNYAME